MKAANEKQHILTAKIKFYKDVTGFSKEQLATVTGITTRTWDRYMHEPEKFTVSQIVSLSKIFGTTDLIDTIAGMVGKVKK